MDWLETHPNTSATYLADLAKAQLEALGKRRDELREYAGRAELLLRESPGILAFAMRLSRRRRELAEPQAEALRANITNLIGNLRALQLIADDACSEVGARLAELAPPPPP